ncbi:MULTISPECIES: DUF4383 domain-containing protein [Calidithermus]|jgi:hypothetical protein|uniref:DUF4383 domain-containing protein n=1 Tax=Calidithermus roseus TaxID=1644118 RepID=A0A399ELI3_9DEIN|nr:MULTISPECIES: DUF4383 domain-containing protein [Calidithermus]RIH84506.1 hypothetical protein Mrose_02608 [Calidithermus roseus]
MGTQIMVARIIGVVLTLVGLVGFFSGSSLLGFGINGLHNVVHLASGLIGLWASYGGWAKSYNQIFGVIYLAVTVLGFIAPGFMTSLLNVNMADNILHLVLGVVLAYVGFMMREPAKA